MTKLPQDPKDWTFQEYEVYIEGLSLAMQALAMLASQNMFPIKDLVFETSDGEHIIPISIKAGCMDKKEILCDPETKELLVATLKYATDKGEIKDIVITESVAMTLDNHMRMLVPKCELLKNIIASRKHEQN